MFALVVLLCLNGMAWAETSKPNILFIMADDYAAQVRDDCMSSTLVTIMLDEPALKHPLKLHDWKPTR